MDRLISHEEPISYYSGPERPSEEEEDLDAYCAVKFVRERCIVTVTNIQHQCYGDDLYYNTDRCNDGYVYYGDMIFVRDFEPWGDAQDFEGAENGGGEVHGDFLDVLVMFFSYISEAITRCDKCLSVLLVPIVSEVMWKLRTHDVS